MRRPSRHRQLVVRVWPHGAAQACVRGPVRAVSKHLRGLGIAWEFDANRGAYLIPRARLEELSAAVVRDGNVVVHNSVFPSRVSPTGYRDLADESVSLW